jgi:hypothetical protein
MPCPERLYKYQPLTAYSLAGLVNGSVWLSKASALNDPLDCAITIDRGKLEESVRQATLDAGAIAPAVGQLDIRSSDRKAFEQFRSQVLDLLQNMGVCSLSAVSDSLLMWSHYAQHHRGFCVEYDSSEGTRLRELAREVLYSDDTPSFSAKDITTCDGESALHKLWLTKASCWSYEREWRVIMAEGNKSFQAPSTILSLAFGARMPESDRRMIAFALRNERQIAFKEAKLIEGKYKLEIVDL